MTRVGDASRFIRYHRVATESSPLQVYSSSLIFSPTQSITRICYQTERPGWLVNESAMADDWSSCLQTLEGHSAYVTSVAWSPDGRQLASGSHDETVRIWDPVTGQCISTLEGHSGSVLSVTWSLDGRQLASASDDKTVRIWHPATGRCTSTLAVNSPEGVQFDEAGLNLLYTSIDTLKIENVVPMKTSLDNSAPLPQQTEYGFNNDGTWITYKGENLLWLPSECRPAISSTSTISSNMAIGCSSGRVLIFNFSKQTPVISPQTSKGLFKPGGHRRRTIFSRLFSRK